jgi:hypothetical protein
MWNGSRNTLTEANTFINNQRDIAYGLEATRATDHQGGVIRNNFISRTSVTAEDVAIGVFNSANTQVLNNTVRLVGTYPYAVEYRFAATTGVVIRNNLTNAAIVARDGATGTISENVTNGQASWFVNAAAHDLHLTSAATPALDKAATLANVTTDIDAESRSQDAGPDIGADEYVSGGAAGFLSLARDTTTAGSGANPVTAQARDVVQQWLASRHANLQKMATSIMIATRTGRGSPDISLVKPEKVPKTLLSLPFPVKPTVTPASKIAFLHRAPFAHLGRLLSDPGADVNHAPESSSVRVTDLLFANRI